MALFVASLDIVRAFLAGLVVVIDDGNDVEQESGDTFIASPAKETDDLVEEDFFRLRVARIFSVSAGSCESLPVETIAGLPLVALLGRKGVDGVVVDMQSPFSDPSFDDNEHSVLEESWLLVPIDTGT